MNRTITAFFLVVFSSINLLAQSDDVKKAELFAGYSFGSVGINFGFGGVGQQFYQDRVGQHGFNGSAVFNVSRHVGIKGDVSGTYQSGRFAFQVPSGFQSMPLTTVTIDANASLYNFLGGVQFKDNSSRSRLKPFAHAMVGAGHRRDKIRGGGMTCIAIIPCPGSTTETGFAAAFGGGLDVRLNNTVAFRIFQIDYNPIKFNSGVDHNVRVGAGMVF